MDQNQNRRADDRRPALPLRWGERFTLLLTGPNAGVVGAYGATWPGQPAEYERVNVCVEGAQKLDDIEQYRLQMAGISTAALGYWKEGDTIHPDYDTPALRDVARLYAKYDDLFKFREQVLNITPGEIPAGMSETEYWKRYAAGEKACNDQLKRRIAELTAAPQWRPIAEAPRDGTRFWYLRPTIVVSTTEPARIKYDIVEVWRKRTTPDSEGYWMNFATSMADHELSAGWFLLSDGGRASLPIQARADRLADPVDAAMVDAVVNGTGAFRVNGDGSTERVDWQRDALHPDYVKMQGEPDKIELTEEQRRYYAELVAFARPQRELRQEFYGEFQIVENKAIPPGAAVVVAGDKPENRGVITGLDKPKDGAQ